MCNEINLSVVLEKKYMKRIYESSVLVTRGFVATLKFSHLNSYSSVDIFKLVWHYFLKFNYAFLSIIYVLNTD